MRSEELFLFQNPSLYGLVAYLHVWTWIDYAHAVCINSNEYYAYTESLKGQ